MTVKAPKFLALGAATLIVAALPLMQGCSDAETGTDGTGGVVATGGTSSMGTGGASPGSGGAMSSGGTPSTSGGSASGGTASGGTASTSGGSATGGSATAGSATGGSNAGTSSGGSSSGGFNAKGGTSSGGSSSGASSGGSSTGGASSGGSNAKGGSSSGGASSGGSSSGGSNAKGGSSSGGASSGGSSGGGAGGGCASGITDAKQDLLSKYTPKNSDLADLFEDYVASEIGTPTIGTVGTGTARTITAPIYVPACVSYDGKGEKLTGKGMGDGSQNEGQKPIFILAPGASVKNVTITAPGCEGIHMLGNNVVENVVWEDVGEDAASMRSYFPGGTILISGGSAKSAEDKTFQFNVQATVTIRNFTATDIGKLVRQNGGEDFPLAIILENVTANNVKDAVIMSDSPQCTVKATNLTTNASTRFDGCRQI